MIFRQMMHKNIENGNGVYQVVEIPQSEEMLDNCFLYKSKDFTNYDEKVIRAERFIEENIRLTDSSEYLDTITLCP